VLQQNGVVEQKNHTLVEMARTMLSEHKTPRCFWADARVTRSSRSAHLSCFTNTYFVALLEPRYVGHTLSDSSWVNAMHEDLENFERNHV
jgi:hypothetical protein